MIWVTIWAVETYCFHSICIGAANASRSDVAGILWAGLLPLLHGCAWLLGSAAWQVAYG